MDGTNLTENLPGPLKGSNPFLLAALFLSIIAALVVMTGDVGWVYSREVFYPYHYPDDVAQVSYHDYSYDFSDGGLYATGIAAISLLLLLAALMALLGIIRARSVQAHYILLGGLVLAVCALLASLGASSAFNSWAEDEEFDDWGVGSSIWGGIVGSFLLLLLFAIPLYMAWPTSSSRPPPYPHPPGAMPRPGPPPAGPPPAAQAHRQPPSGPMPGYPPGGPALMHPQGGPPLPVQRPPPPGYQPPPGGHEQ